MAAAGTGRWQAVILAVLRERESVCVEDILGAAGAPRTRPAIEAVRRAIRALADQAVITVERAPTGRPTTHLIARMNYPESTRRQQTPRAVSCYGETVDRITPERTTERVAEFITVAEFGRATCKTPDCVRRLLREGKLEGVQIGGTWRIPISALTRLEQQATARGGFLSQMITK